MKYISKELQKEIQDKFFKDYKLFKTRSNQLSIPPTCFMRIFKVYPEIKTICENILHQQPKFQKLSNILNSIILDKDLKECETCHCEMTYEQSRDKSKYCSLKCTQNNKEFIQQRLSALSASNMEKYGVAWSFERTDVKEKCISSYMVNFGVDNPYKSPEIIKKIKQTKLERYDSENWNNHDKAIETLKTKYAISSDITCPIQIKEIYNKTFKTIEQNFGLSCIFNIPEIRHNTLIAHSKKSYKDIILCDEKYEPLFSFDDFLNRVDESVMFKWKCKKCQTIFEASYSSGTHAPCPNCYPKKSGTSAGEFEILHYIESIYTGKITHGSFKIIPPYQLDLYLPELKIGIEYNGIWHHSVNKNQFENYKFYHINKTKLCEAREIKLINIWEDEWINNPIACKQLIFDYINNDISKYFNEFNNIIILNRDKFNKCVNINNYYLQYETEPELITRQKFKCYNCGKLFFVKDFSKRIY